MPRPYSGRPFFDRGSAAHGDNYCFLQLFQWSLRATGTDIQSTKRIAETETPTSIRLDQQIGSLENVGPNGASVECYDHYLGIGERRIIIRLLVTTQLPRTGLPILVDGGVAFGHVHP